MTDERSLQGRIFSKRADEASFREGLRAAVGYRGDVSLTLANGEEVEGYLFNFLDERLDLLLPEREEKFSLPVSDVEVLRFSGRECVGKDRIPEEREVRP